MALTPKVSREAANEASRRYRVRHSSRVKIAAQKYRQLNAKKRRDIGKASCQAHPEAYLIATARNRAKKKGIVFSISVEDVVIPEFCPWLGFRLSKTRTGKRGTSPSIDRIDNSKGYIKGNIEIISSRANAIKSDCSLDELILLGSVAERRKGS